VVIENVEEAAFLSNTVKPWGHTWIGLSDQAVPGDYHWVNGTPLGTFNQWDMTNPDAGSPNDAMGQCVQFGNDGLWQNYPCGYSDYLLCERP